MTKLKDLCCVEACVLLSPNERQGAELVRLGLLELSQHNLLTIMCSPASTTIVITQEQLEEIEKHDIYKALHIFLKELFSSESTASLSDIISTAKKYFGLGLNGFHKYAITPSLKSKNLLSEEHYKRFFVLKAVKLNLTDDGETLKKDLITSLNHPEQLVEQHALLVPNQGENFSQATQSMMRCFNKAYAKQFKSTNTKIVKEPGLF